MSPVCRIFLYLSLYHNSLSSYDSSVITCSLTLSLLWLCNTALCFAQPFCTISSVCSCIEQQINCFLTIIKIITGLITPTNSFRTYKTCFRRRRKNKYGRPRNLSKCVDNRRNTISTESASRKIQSIICNVHLSVHVWRPCLPVDWRLLVKELLLILAYLWQSWRRRKKSRTRET